MVKEEGFKPDGRGRLAWAPCYSRSGEQGRGFRGWEQGALARHGVRKASTAGQLGLRVGAP